MATVHGLGERLATVPGQSASRVNIVYIYVYIYRQVQRVTFSGGLSIFQ